MYYLPGTLKGQFPDWNQSDGGKLMLALLGGAPMLVGMVGCLLGGLLTDRYIRRTGDRKWGRRLFAMIGYAMAGVCYLTAAQFTDNLWVFAGCVMHGRVLQRLDHGPELGGVPGHRPAVLGDRVRDHEHGRQPGRRSSASRSPGGSSKPTRSTATSTRKGTSILFTIYGIVYFLGVGLWLLIDASKPIQFEDEVPAMPVETDPNWVPPRHPIPGRRTSVNAGIGRNRAAQVAAGSRVTLSRTDAPARPPCTTSGR